jgi:ATP-dependent RNA helicase DDX27
MESFLQESKGRKAKKAQSIVDVAYRRAKSMKATSKRVPDAGKGKADKTGKQHSDKAPSRQEEMHDLFQNDMSEWKQGQFSTQEIK